MSCHVAKKKEHRDLIVQNKVPKFFEPKCVNSGCNVCGVDKLRMKECPVLGSCDRLIDVIEWKEAP